MSDQDPSDYYEALQISENAELDTIHRVYRLLAQRFHPDNKETGNDNRFRVITEAYTVLSNPETRAQYDVKHQERRQQRWRLVSTGAQSQNDFATEQILRLTVLEALYAKRRFEPGAPGIFPMDFEELIGQPREQIEFAVWYLVQKRFVQRSDNSALIITGEGVEHLEQNYQQTLQQRRLREKNEQ